MKKPNYEDFIMKRAMDLFAEEGLKFFGVDKKVKAVGATEIVVLEAKNMFMDYTFLWKMIQLYILSFRPLIREY